VKNHLAISYWLLAIGTFLISVCACKRSAGMLVSVKKGLLAVWRLALLLTQTKNHWLLALLLMQTKTQKRKPKTQKPKASGLSQYC
jgi:hypothetical protein